MTARTLHGVDAARVDMAIGATNVDVTYRAVAAGLRMPEKTSYFWPKPRTGMVFRSLES